MKTLEFYFDIVSTYSYLAHTQLDALARRTGATIAWKPFLLGAVFKETGNSSPITVPVKAAYTLRDAERWAEAYKVPFKLNSRFPFSSVKALRLVLWAERSGRAIEVAKAAFAAAFVDDHDLTAEDELRRIATKAGLAPDEAILGIEEPAIKEQLKKNTEEAIRRGVFGAPTFFVGEDMFWGNDRLVFVESALTSTETR